MWTGSACLGAALLLGFAAGCGNRHATEASRSAPPQLAGVADSELAAPRAYADVLLEGFPHVRQKPDFCGEACVEMALRNLGRPLTQDEVFNRSGVDPALGRGVYASELRATLERVGFEPGAAWFQVGAAKASAELPAQFDALHDDLRQGVPSIVCMHYSDSPGATEHFRLILGYDAAKDEVIYHEPAEDGGAYRRMTRGRFLRLWPLKYTPGSWTVIRMRLKPGAAAPEQPPTSEAKASFSRADYAQHVLALRRKIGPNFTVLIEPPFVVIGDSSPTDVRRFAAGTVRWAVTKLKQDYFSKDPAAILDVFLFKDEESYRRNTLAFFDERPGTPYGYYSAKHKALIMDISTGGGTLVHEIVHPFIEANFVDCPPWFNEGLGSLYEQSGEEKGRIYGYTNWRLTGLKRAIKAGQVPSFRDLMAASPEAFYEEDRGTNYAVSRYLLYYLQEKGLLGQFYRRFHENRKTDPTGYETLQRLLGEEDMDAFKAKWEAFALGLVFP